MFYFYFFFFKLRGLEHEISKLAIKGIQKRQNILNKSHQLSRYKANNGKMKKKYLMHFDSDARVFVLTSWYKEQLCDKFSLVIFICLTPFSQIQFVLIGCMILMIEYVSLTTATMKMGKYIFTVIIVTVAKRKESLIG